MIFTGHVEMYAVILFQCKLNLHYRATKSNLNQKTHCTEIHHALSNDFILIIFLQYANYTKTCAHSH